ncbi:MAG: hypothetical protein NTW52_07175 [Planctomycetota bacterium]|nr:hypothetical protein [Planctomycetota bacterium]
MTNTAKNKQNQFDPFWNAILSGTVVALLLLAILPSPRVDFIYRVKTVATQQRLAALQNRMAAQPKGQLSEGLLNGNIGLQFITSRLIESTPPKVAAVLSTRQNLPQRVLAEVTFLADRKYQTDEIQTQLEEISLSKIKSDEILQLEQRKRTLEWEIASAQHLSDQLVASNNAANDFKVVSTYSVDESALQRNWKSVIATKQELYDQLVDQIRTASLRASGFVAIAGKPKVFPQVTGTTSMSTVVAFFAGALTSCVVFMLLRSIGSSHVKSIATPSRSLAFERKTSVRKLAPTSRLDQGAVSGLRMADRISKLGIPYFGAIESSGIAVSSSQGSAKDDASVSITNGDKSNMLSSPFESGYVTPIPSISIKSTQQESKNHQDVWSVPLQRSLEWLLILWMAAVVIRFFSDDIWRSLVLQSPLTGLAKLFSGIA